MRRTTLSVLSALAILLSGMIVPEAAAQSRRDKEQTYVLEKPYEVKKLVPPTGKKIKNVILMIGDGMSLMHMYSAWTANRGKLWLDNSQYTGLSKTYCANRLITDSGAGGTALATGHKTNYHMVGVDPEGKPLESLTTLANKKGLSSGIAVTCRLWDATPADFCCHNTDRDAEAEIVADYVNCGVDYVFGGGSKQGILRYRYRRHPASRRARRSLGSCLDESDRSAGTKPGRFLPDGRGLPIG